MAWILLKKLEVSNSTTGRPKRGPSVSQYRSSTICSTEEEVRAEIKNRKEHGQFVSVLAQLRRERTWAQKSHAMRSALVRRRLDGIQEKLDALQEENQIRELAVMEKLVRRNERKSLGVGRPGDILVLPPITPVPTPEVDQVDGGGNDPIDLVRASNAHPEEETMVTPLNVAETGSGQTTAPSTSAPFITTLPREATRNPDLSDDHFRELSDQLPELIENGVPLPVGSQGELPGRSLSVPDVQAATASDFRRLSHPQDVLLPPAAQPAVPTDADQTGSVRRRHRRRSRISLDMSGIDFKKNPTYSQKLTSLRRRVSQIETEEMTSRVRDFVASQTTYERRRRQGVGRYSLDIPMSL